MLEKEVETYLVRQVNKLGGIAYKFVSPNRRSVPDRICVFPTGEIVFVECKRPGGKLTSGQAREIMRLRQLRQRVHVVYSKGDVDLLVEVWQ